MPGLDLLRDEPGREETAAGLSDVKKLDFRLPGDGDGGICESVSIVRSDKDGLGLRDNVRGVYGGSMFSGPKGSAGTLGSAGEQGSACCGWVMVLSAVPANAGLRWTSWGIFGDETFLVRVLFPGLNSEMDCFCGMGNLDSLGIPDDLGRRVEDWSMVKEKLLSFSSSM